VPYLHDWRLGVRSFEGDEASQRQQVSAAFADVYRRLADRATAEFAGLPLVATGHLTCLPRAGDQPGEQDAVPEPIHRVGTIGALGPAIFDERFAHVALGHLHRSFPVAGRRIWYSGTPVQFSAAEPPDARVVLLVDLDGAGSRVEPLPVPVTRRLLKVAGDLDAVRARLPALEWADGELPPYLLADVVLPEHRPRLREELQGLLREGPGGRPQLVELRARAAQAPGREAEAALPAPDALTPEVAFRFAWGLRNQGAAPPEPVLRRFLSLLEGQADG
jgi:exonuclease SbcD